MKRNHLLLLLVTLILDVTVVYAAGPQWKPANGPLMTRWSEDVSPEKALPEYPRPQMVRRDWKNLNGLWELEVTKKDSSAPVKYSQRILVPFPIESALSGVMKRVDENNRLWYRRTFELPASWKGRRILLHFGAVDWEANVYVNGRHFGTHRGGYDAFTFDITDSLNSSGSQELTVSVWDPTDAGTQPRGKQVKRPGGIMYTPSTGIWQTVWLEPVPETYIRSLKIIPDIDRGEVSITVNVVGADGHRTNAEVTAANFSGSASSANTNTLKVGIPSARLWSPDSPHLYDLTVSITKGGQTIDAVEGYFGMRKISLGKDENGITRITFNNEFLFQIGPLDQGFWPDGLYTAPTDEALRYDIEVTKQHGFNMARKHVKIEPARWYYWCDRLGLLVWQDMPSGNNRGTDARKQFELELKRLVDGFHNHPSIVMWVPFNEGWGQFDTARLVNLIKEQDPTRLVDNASGWTDRGVGDVHDIHSYPGPDAPDPEADRAAVLGEFGGLGLKIKGHSWQQEAWGYQQMAGREELTGRYEELLQGISRLKAKPGLSAAVYTQTTDIETECNGLLTYDREIMKMDVRRVTMANQGYLPPMFTNVEDIFIDGIAVELTLPPKAGRTRYTLDGSEPSEKSDLYAGPIALTGTATVKACTFWTDGTKSAVTSRTFTQVQPQRPEDITTAVPGLTYDYYQGRWTELPDFDHLEPLASGTCQNFDLTPAPHDTNFALKFQGHISIARDGVYVFYVRSDDGARLYIADAGIVNNDGTHGMVQKHGQVPLKAGKHRIKLLYFQGEGGKGLEVSYQGPGLKKQQIPAEALLHTKN